MLGQILAYQAVGVLAGPALPGVVRLGKVELSRGQSLNALIVVELRPVIRSNGPDLIAPDHENQGLAGLLHGFVSQFANEDEPGLAVDQGQDAGLGPGPMHEIRFKMSLQKPLFRGRRPLRDVSFPAQNAAAVMRSISLSSAFTALAQVLVKNAAVSLVSPDIPIDGLVADAHHPAPAKHQGNLLWRPIRQEKTAD